jgi:Kef-type K+ transport system membrane component KefB
VFAVTDAFSDTAVVLALAAIVAFIALRTRQPLIVAFIGFAFLLFLVGLKLDVALVKSTGKVALYAGVGQIAFTAALGFVLSFVLGMSALAALSVADHRWLEGAAEEGCIAIIMGQDPHES